MCGNVDPAERIIGCGFCSVSIPVTIFSATFSVVGIIAGVALLRSQAAIVSWGKIFHSERAVRAAAGTLIGLSATFFLSAQTVNLLFCGLGTYAGCVEDENQPPPNNNGGG